MVNTLERTYLQHCHHIMIASVAFVVFQLAYKQEITY